MELTLDENQVAIRELARDVLARFATTTRIEQVETSEDRFDHELWAELARTGLLGVAVPEARGGLGFGMVELTQVCEQVGRAVAPVPFVAATVAALAVADVLPDHANQLAVGDPDGVIAVAPSQSCIDLRIDGSYASGHVIGVPWARPDGLVLLDVSDGLYLLDCSDPANEVAAGTTTGGQRALDITVTRSPVTAVGDAAAAHRHRLRWLTALAAAQAGVCAGAVRITADYTSQREQFGKPLSTFQGVALKAADAYVDATAIAANALQAAWLLDQGLDAEPAVLAAAWWAAEGGQHCVHVTQHLHGGMGADVSYPIHRFFLWGKQIELLVGGASSLLAQLGDALAVRPDAGDAVVIS